jgi:hypothetical protein
MPSTRKTHQKSRRGCGQCKRRHVKCDEGRPICTTCSRLDLPCIYGKKGGTHTPEAVTNLQISTPNAACSILDLQLMHHYSACSCVRFAPGTARHKCWTSDVPELSFTHPFLLHQILAVAALHRYTLAAHSPLFRDAALDHRAKALELVQPVMSNRDETSAIALFAFAGLTAIYAYGEVAIQIQTHRLGFDVVKQLVQCFKLNRGISSIVDAHREHLEGSWAEDMINLKVPWDDWDFQSTYLRLKHADRLQDLIRDGARSMQLGKVYLEAMNRCMNSIQLLLSQRNHDDDIYFLIMAWPNEVDEEFMRCLERKDQIALIILAHYAVLMSLRPKLWWLQEWSQLLVHQIASILCVDYQLYLDWPRHMIETIPRQQGYTPIL